ncbi:hypothetical protein ACFL1A_01740 [Patescibacteria group bacterium]
MFASKAARAILTIIMMIVTPFLDFLFYMLYQYIGYGFCIGGFVIVSNILVVVILLLWWIVPGLLIRLTGGEATEFDTSKLDTKMDIDPLG